MKTFWVYMLASSKNGTLYIGVTNDLRRRIFEHKNDLMPGFTKEHQIHNLVWFDCSSDVTSAIILEKQMKKWKRAWKIELIEKDNPGWLDLYEGL